MAKNDAPRRLLAVYSHPDDESFGSGGTLARYAKSGADVRLVCATRGEVGEIADPSLATPETLPQVREQELRNAASALGISEVTFLGYRDSGMAGTPDNDNPKAFVNAPEDEVVRQLVGIIRRFRPQVLMTFAPDGGYGHPDHVTAHHRAVSALHASADAQKYQDSGEPWQVSRLVYAVFFTKSLIREMIAELHSLGLDASRFEQREREGVGWSDEQVHVVMDVSDTVANKWAALGSHKTQFGTFHVLRRLPEDVANRFASREHFCIAWPEPAPGTKLNDLFDGV